MLDNLMIRAVEQAFGFGFPTEAGAVLIIEVDGLDAGLDREAAGDRRDRPGRTAARSQKSIAWRTRKEPEYVAIWKSRKSAFGAIGRLSPTFCTQDGVVPRTKLPHILRLITAVGERHNLRIANVFHAGDGNIHPILLFDERDPDQVAPGPGGQPRDPRRVHRRRRQRHRRARDRRREDGVHAQALLARGPRRDGRPPARRSTPTGRCSPDKMLPGGGGCIERKSPGHRASA